MRIDTLLEAVNRDRLTIADDIGQHADDMPVRDTAFNKDTIIAANQIIILAHSDDAMQHILSVIALVKRDIQPLHG